MRSMFTGAMYTTVKLTISHFHTMPDNLASTVGTRGCHRMDGAFETIKRPALASLDDFKCLVVFISADITFRHRLSFLYGSQPCERGRKVINESKKGMLS